MVFASTGMPAEDLLSDESGINRLSMPLIQVQQAVMLLAWQSQCLDSRSWHGGNP